MKLRYTVISIMIIMISGCATNNSNYGLSYKSSLLPMGSEFPTYVPLKNGETPKIHPYAVIGDSEFFSAWMGRGYTIIGQATNFSGSPEKEESALLKQARRVGATDVAYSTKYTDAAFLAKFSPGMLYEIYNEYPSGLCFTEISPAPSNEVSMSFGAQIFWVYEGSPAFNAGLLGGDIVLEINGEKVINEKDANSKVGRIRKDTDSIVLSIIRDGIKKEIVVDMSKESPEWRAWGE